MFIIDKTIQTPLIKSVSQCTLKINTQRTEIMNIRKPPNQVNVLVGINTVKPITDLKYVSSIFKEVIMFLLKTCKFYRLALLPKSEQLVAPLSKCMCR